MATANPFDLLGDDDNDDPTQLLAAQQHKLPPPSTKISAAPAAAPPAKTAGKLPSKPLPPSQAVREAKSEAPRGGRGGGGRGFGRAPGGRGYNRDTTDTNNSFEGNNNGFSGGYSSGYSSGYIRPEDGGDGERNTERRSGGYGGPRGRYGGGRRGGYSNGETGEGERPRRVYERHSGTGRGNGLKREGAGRGNWGTPTDDIALENEEPVNETDKIVEGEKQVGQEEVGDSNKETLVTEPEEKEPEDKEMTLEEYEKVLEEKRKTLISLKTEERKVALDKELQSMQLLANKKKNDDDIFIKLGSDKDKRKEAVEKEERAKKSLSINEFLKPAEGERFNGGRGRGRGRGRGTRGGFSESNTTSYAKSAPKIEDVGQFPSLGGK